MKFSEMEYQRLDLDVLRQKANTIIEEFETAQSGAAQFEVHKKYYALKDEVATTVIIARIRHDIDTADEFYNQENNYYDEILPEIQNLEMMYLRKVYESPYRDYLEEKIGKVAFANMDVRLHAIDEKILPLMKQENALTSQYDNLIASAKIDWDGEVLNLSLLRKYLTSNDREVRASLRKIYTVLR